MRTGWFIHKACLGLMILAGCQGRRLVASAIDAGQATQGTALYGDAASAVAPAYPVIDGGDRPGLIEPEFAWQHFDELLTGTWLIGWHGGENHFSWIRFAPQGTGLSGSKFQILAGNAPAIPLNVAYWPCSGSGEWYPAERPATVDLAEMPKGCEHGVLVFKSFAPESSHDGALLEADIDGCTGDKCGMTAWTKLVGTKFPDSYCDVGFTTCRSPF